MQRKDFAELDFDQALERVSNTIDLRSSGRIHRRGLGRMIDALILLRQGFQETWQFMVLFQAFWLFLGLLPNVTEVLNGTFELIGISIRLETVELALASVVVMVLLLAFGVTLLLYGGSKRHQMLINQRQNPGQKLDYEAFRLVLSRLDEVEKKVESSGAGTPG
ncbi:MAG: hypothetical protein MAG715_01233 [Methanonatronarchaeales archaeon]|nr:hypothetical protein [Methanonatronarchaeales archaeon]